MRKYFDIKPVCRNAHQHYQIRRWLQSIPTFGWFIGDIAVLIAPDWKDPCKTKIVSCRSEPTSQHLTIYSKRDTL